MGRAVLLLHELPDGSSHFDWMIQRAGGPGAPLLTFRVVERPDRAGVFEAQAIGDHRAAYLTLEGEVSGGRGRVSRVAEGDLVIEAESAGVVRVRGRLGGVRGVFEGRRIGVDLWSFTVAPDRPDAPSD